MPEPVSLLTMLSGQPSPLPGLGLGFPRVPLRLWLHSLLPYSHGTSSLHGLGSRSLDGQGVDESRFSTGRDKPPQGSRIIAINRLVKSELSAANFAVHVVMELGHYPLPDITFIGVGFAVDGRLYHALDSFRSTGGLLKPPACGDDLVGRQCKLNGLMCKEFVAPIHSVSSHRREEGLVDKEKVPSVGLGVR